MLELKDISFDVEDKTGDVEILKDINLSIGDNTFVAITGPNGGGKSTLANIIMGIYKPTSGKIIYDGEDITDLDETERAKKGISFAFQTPVRFKGLTVFDLLKIASKKKINVSEACEYLSEVGLCARDYINREVNSSLSGGELKRIEIATVLARDGKLTVFDEPEAGIDLWSFQNLIQVFENLQANNNGTIIVISHQERILEIADEIIVISNGSVYLEGPGKEILPQILGTDSAQIACSVLEGRNK